MTKISLYSRKYMETTNLVNTESMNYEQQIPNRSIKDKKAESLIKFCQYVQCLKQFIQ